MVEHDSKECIRISQYKYNNKIKYKNGNEPKIEYIYCSQPPLPPHFDIFCQPTPIHRIKTGNSLIDSPPTAD